MPGPAGADDPALEQARLAQLAPRAYADAWLCRHTASAGAPRPAPHARAAAVQGVTPPVMQQAAQRAGGAETGAVPTRAGISGATAADGSVQTAEAKQAARPKPVPPPRSGEQREAARLQAVQLAGERKMIRARLRAGEETLEQALARADEVAGRMRTDTLLRALPGIGAATAARLMHEAGIDAARRAGGITTAERARLLDSVAAVHAELAAAAVTAAPVTAPAARQQGREASPALAPSPARGRAAGSLPPGNRKATSPENARDDRSQIAAGRGLRVSRKDIQAALREQAAREKPLSHNAIARRLGIQQGNRAVDRACADLVANSSLTNCPHRFTESGGEAPGRKPAAHAKPAVRHGRRVTIRPVVYGGAG